MNQNAIRIFENDDGRVVVRYLEIDKIIGGQEESQALIIHPSDLVTIAEELNWIDQEIKARESSG